MAKRIAFINFSTGWGGLEMNVIKLSHLFLNRGYEVDLVSAKDCTIYKNEGNAFSSIFFVNRHLKYLDIPAAASIARHLKLAGISIVMVFDNKDLDIVFWVKSLFLHKLRVIYQQHKLVGISKKDIIHTMRFNAIDVWITPTAFLQEEVMAKTSFPAGKIRIVPLCCNIEKIRTPYYRKEEARARLKIKPHLLIGTLGRISRKKGQLFLVKAISELRREGLEIELLITGSPTVDDMDCFEYYKEILNTIDREKLNDFIYMAGHTAEVSLFYSAIDIFVLPSENETYGMVTIEAMLSGIPVLATDTGSTREILCDGSLGSLYSCNDYNDFREQLLWLIHHPEQANERALKAQKHAVKMYDEQKEVEQIDLILNGGEEEQ